MKKIIAFLFLFTFYVAAYTQNNIPSLNKVEKSSDKAQEFFENKIKATKSVNEKPSNKIADPIELKKVVLDNGLTVLLSENHDLPQIFGMVVVKAGGKNDPADATGLAHYLEHMLFKGTETMGTIDYEKEKPYLDSINNLYEALGKTTDETLRKDIQKKINDQSILAGDYAIANELDKLLAQIGGSGVNAFTTEDFTAYHNTFPANQVDRWLELYSHRFEKPVFRLFQSELETVYEEKNRGLDNTFGQVFEQFSKEFYKVHPYGQQSIIGSTEHLKNPPLKKMYDYFNTYYVGNNMALVLSGDFNTEEIIPKIKETFGDWRTGEIPTFPNYEEKPFNGKEIVEKKLTPIKVGILGFRSPANGEKDEAAVNVAVNILANEQRTGLIDKLSIEGKIMEAGVFSLPYNDYGATLIFYIPKIVGQSLEDAEKVAFEAISALKNGDFSDEYFEAIKFNMLQDIERKWESNEERVLEMAYCFTQNREWNDYIENYYSISSLTKNDIINAAKKYFGDNYLCFQSKTGFPKNEKLAKPDFEPVIPKNESKSEFRTAFEQIESSKSIPHFVDFNKDLTISEVKPGIDLECTSNPFNDIFSLRIKYGIGKYDLPILQQTAQYLNLIGTKDKDANKIKEEFYQLGASFYFEADEQSISCYIEGNDQKLVETLLLYENFINNLNPDKEQVKKLLENIQMEQKFNRREPDFIAKALNEYAIYGNNSSFKRELTSKELKSLTPESLLTAFDKARTYSTTFYYTGNRDKVLISDFIKTNMKFNEALQPAKETVVLNRNNPSKNEIYLIDRKKAVQSQIYFNIEGKARNNKDIAQVNAFNSYFGDDMSSLVFQEIREFRSLAYTAYGKYLPAIVNNKNNRFLGYIGCQGDKTLDAMGAMMELLNNMPEKPERIDIIRSALQESAKSSRPGFRDLLKKVDDWKDAGYNQDPNSLYIDQYNTISFNNITDFYKNEIQNKPLTISIVGDSKRFDLKELAKYGEIIKVKESDLFVN